MRRYFTVVEGPGKGASRELTSNLTVIGRSKNADLQVEDPLVSRLHLEVKVEAGGVFVENKSAHGSQLNGRPLVGVVPLSSGDVLGIGDTKLCFGEDEDAAPKPGDIPERTSSGIDGTRLGEGLEELIRDKGKDAAPDSTRAFVEGGTRMLSASELPKWAAQEKERKSKSSRGLWAAVSLLAVLAALGGAYWYYFLRSQASAGASIKYADSLYGIGLEYPSDWSKVEDDAGVIAFGSPEPDAGQRARLAVYTDRDADFSFTGLTDGFDRYRDTLKRRHDGFGLLGSKTMNVGGATVVFFAFTGTGLQGKGIYLLNDEARVVVECFAPDASFGRYAPTFSAILQSFRLQGTAAQQFIDFPLPDEGMRQLALSDTAELARQADACARLGAQFLADKDVRPDNLFEAVRNYRRAVQLAVSPPQRLPSYRAAAQGLREATAQFDQKLREQRFEITRALKEGNTDAAFWEANRMMQMVADKTDPAYQEAYKIVQSLQHPH